MAGSNSGNGRSAQIEFSPVGWVGGAELSYDEWLRQGSRLGLAGRNAAWWIGDWVRYGSARYGSKYTAAVRVTGYDRQTLMNMVYVASRFDFSRRRENLSWSHHSEVAALDADQQDHWLDLAASERLSVRDLREELTATKIRAGRLRQGDAVAQIESMSGQPGPSSDERSLGDPDAEEVRPGAHVACPHCGHTFVP